MIPASPCPCTAKTSFLARHRPTDVSISSSPADSALLPISSSARTTSRRPAFIHPITPESSPGWPPSDPARYVPKPAIKRANNKPPSTKKMKTKNITTSRSTNSINRSPLPRTFFLISVLLGCCFASAAAITVTNNNDNGPGSLRQAISDSLPGDTIDFDSSLNGQTILLTTGELLIDKSLTIAGPGANLLAVDGTHASRVVNIGPGFEVTISGLTIVNGFSPDVGGGILNFDALTMVLGNTILNAGTQGENIVNLGTGIVTSFGYNMSSDPGGGSLYAVGDRINTNPQLNFLADNGGPTFTHALLPGSPAIDAGDPNFNPNDFDPPLAPVFPG